MATQKERLDAAIKLENTMAAKKAAPETKKIEYSIIRCYSGVFFGRIVARRGSEADVVECRHIHQWDSVGLPRLALTTEDLAILGVGSGTRISGPCEATLLEIKAIATCTPEAARIISEIPCRA